MLKYPSYLNPPSDLPLDDLEGSKDDRTYERIMVSLDRRVHNMLNKLIVQPSTGKVKYGLRQAFIQALIADWLVKNVVGASEVIPDSIRHNPFAYLDGDK